VRYRWTDTFDRADDGVGVGIEEVRGIADLVATFDRRRRGNVQFVCYQVQ
jgi:hypothetical protein